jgi:hypothetical protein
MGAFFYEVVLNPTRASSTIFTPQLFRLSANDVAKVGSKSRLYQTSVRSSGPSPDANTTMPRTIQIISRPPQAHHFPTIHHSPRTRHQAASNLMTNATLSNPSISDSKHQNFFAPSTSFAQSQPKHLTGNNFDQLNNIHAQQRQHQQLTTQIAQDEATETRNRQISEFLSAPRGRLCLIPKTTIEQYRFKRYWCHSRVR